MPTPLWNSLEVAKLAMALLTPVTIALLGIYVHHVSKRFEEAQWKSQKLIEKRIAIYDDIGPLLNDLLCYFTFIGCWKEMRPVDVIRLKRRLDRKIFLAAPLFPATFLQACMHFQRTCFQTYGGWGTEPKLRTKFVRRRDATAGWEQSDEACFSPDEHLTQPTEVQEAYAKVMREFTDAFGMPCAEGTLVTGRLPKDIQ